MLLLNMSLKYFNSLNERNSYFEIFTKLMWHTGTGGVESFA